MKFGVLGFHSTAQARDRPRWGMKAESDHVGYKCVRGYLSNLHI